MFKRNKPRTILQNTREMFWPSMGWIRAFHYTRHRVVRLSDTTHKIALGLALGAGISFTPLLGTHFIQAGALAYMLRANFISALIGTFVGNPWTFPFMWWAAISLGSYLLGLFGVSASATLPEHVDFSTLWEIFRNEPVRIFLPWALGGYLICFTSLIVTYPMFYRLVRTAKKARTKARLRKVRKAAIEITGQKK